MFETDALVLTFLLIAMNTEQSFFIITYNMFKLIN